MTGKIDEIDHELIEQVFGEDGFASFGGSGIDGVSKKFTSAIKMLVLFYEENK